MDWPIFRVARFKIQFTAVALSISALDGSTPLSLSILGMCIGLSYAMASVIAGRLADRCPRIFLLLHADFWRAAILIGFIFLIGHLSSSWLLTFCCTFISLLSAFFDIAFQSILKDFDESYLLFLNSRVELGRCTCEIGGPIAATWIFSYFGTVAALAMNALMYVASFLILWDCKNNFPSKRDIHKTPNL